MKYRIVLVAALVALTVGGCTTAAPQAPQPALAPSYQAGSPVTVTVNVRASDAKTDVSKGQDASGAVSTKGGTQEASATTDVKPTTNVSGIPGK